ncbi:MAG: hypothetical protein ACLR7D_03970 [Lachnospira eligens]
MGTEDNTDYSIDGMPAIAKDINSDMNNKDVKGVVFVLNKKYSEDVRYFLGAVVDSVCECLFNLSNTW